MITRRTVLVLGAGASKEYGYPLGRELRYLLVQVKENSPQLAMIEQATGLKREEITAFCYALRNSELPSIDEFVYHQPQFAEAATCAIALALIPGEERHKLFDTELDPALRLYEYIWTAMMDGRNRESFDEEQKLGFVTFNYDRSLEYYFFKVMQATFGLDVDRTAKLVCRIPIVHVYGRLDPLPWETRPGRGYGHSMTPELLNAARSGIRLLRDARGEQGFQAARQLISDAEAVHFVGFGYHSLNMEGLRADRILRDKQVGGSCYKMLAGERNAVTNKWGIGFHPAHPMYSCIDYLREAGPLLL